MSSRTVSLGADQNVGRFGDYGGRYVPESLIPACRRWRRRSARPGPTRVPGQPDPAAVRLRGPAHPADAGLRLSAELGLTVLLKREDLAHTGSHKINNVLGQAMLARRMGRRG